MQIGFVNTKNRGKLSFDDEILANHLCDEGHNVSCVFWDEHDIPQTGHDLFLNRSTFDYHYRPDDFYGWLDSIEQSGTPLLNDASILRWNAKKTYLRDLAQNGVRTVPTFFIDEMTYGRLFEVLDDCPWDDVILKPLVGASSYKLLRKQIDDIVSPDLFPFRNGNSDNFSFMVQPFMKELHEEGELSFVFFGSHFSHAIRKTPARGEFRVQGQYGGTIERIRPSDDLIAQARAAMELDKLHNLLLYARVDGFLKNGQFYLSELEINEPWLFFNEAPESCALFSQRLQELTQVAA